MLDSASNPFREYREHDSLERYDDAREILLRQLKEHPMADVDTAIRARVLKARVRHAYLDIEEIEEDDAPLWFAVQFGVTLPPKLTELEGIDLETQHVVSFDEVETWERLCALGLPYRKGVAAVLTHRGFRAAQEDSACMERKDGVVAAGEYLEERIEALHELYRRIVRGTTREE